jgi:hypothetical protein
MKKTYRLYRRGSTYYAQNNNTGKQESLKTRDSVEAERIIHAKNEAARGQAINRAMAEVYLRASDPLSAERTWKDVMDEGAKTKKNATLTRWNWAVNSTTLDAIRNLKLIDTRAEHFISVLANGTVSTNVFLRRLHNLAMDLDWISRPILPKKRWPEVEFREKRAITEDEHKKIIAGEHNPAWRAFYELLWHLVVIFNMTTVQYQEMTMGQCSLMNLEQLPRLLKEISFRRVS